MEFPKRERASTQGSPRRSPKATRPGAAAATGADENASPKRLVPPAAAGAASPQRKKVLGERNGGVWGMEEGAASPPPKPAPPSPATLAGRGAGPYDPKTNYTTPRPPFLRYDPELRREILLRVSRAAEVMCDDDSSSTTASGTAASDEDGGSSLASDAAGESPVSSALRSDSDSESEVGDSEEEEEVVPARRGQWVRRLFLLLVCVSCCFCYMCCVNRPGFPSYSEDAVDLDRGIGGMYDAYDHELDSLRLLRSDYMMGPEEDVLEENTILTHEDSKSVDRLYDNRVSPRSLVAVTMMGLTDMCMNVPLEELACQIGSEKSENVPELREGSEMDRFDTEVAVSFQNDKQSSELDCLGDNVPLDSIGSISTHTDNMEELDLWQYENTAEAAKKICSTVKFLWSAMEPHLLQIFACLSFTGLVAALYRYYERSRDCCNCIITNDSLAEQPLSVQHQGVQLSVTSSVQDAELRVQSLEQPMQLTIPNQGLAGSLEVPLVSLEDPVQEPLPKIDPLVTLKVPVIGHGIHDQKLRQGDPKNMKASNGGFLNHSDVDSSKAPVVELLGEFMFANSSSGRSIKELNQNAGDARVHEMLEHLGKDEDVGKEQVHSSIIHSPSVRGAKKEQEKSVKWEMTHARPSPPTPTPLRSSSRLRNKVTSP